MNIDYKHLQTRISELCAQRKISMHKMLKEAGLSKSVMDNIKRERTPSAESLLTIATYFDVSTDYLLTNNTPKKDTKTEPTHGEGSLEWFRAGLIHHGIIAPGEDLTDDQLETALKALDSLITVITKQKAD